jgi:uncharacterized protein (DUF1800 family)
VTSDARLTRVTRAGTDERERAAHLVRRAGFGATAGEIERVLEHGYTATVERLIARSDPGADAVPAPGLTRPPSPLAPDRRELETDAVVKWWLRRMVCSTNPLREKLTWLWHGWFPTAAARVVWPATLLDQNVMLRDLATARFETLTQAVTLDLAMLTCAGGLGSAADAPDDRYARVLLERFMLGPGRSTERDVGDAARALTGWVLDRRSGQVRFDASRFDNGTKTVLGRSGPLHAADVVRAAAAHPACAPYVASRIWSELAYPIEPTDRLAQDLGARFAGNDLEIASLVRDVFMHPLFDAAHSRAALVKSPLEWVVSAHRALSIPVNDTTVRVLDTLGQTPFRPPSIAGWPSRREWLRAWPADARLRIATRLLRDADVAGVAEVAPTRRPAVLANTLGLPGWSTRSERALHAATNAPDPRRVIAVALASPEFLLG